MITEGVKSALAQIAASTIHHHDDAAAVADVPIDGARRAGQEAAQEAPSPTPKPKTETDLLLDSVLSALPEPKAPGQGRSRRRVRPPRSPARRSRTTPSED